MTHYRTELDFGNGRIYMTISADLTAEDEKTLINDGWVFLNNGVCFDDNEPAYYFYKIAE